MSEPDSTKGTLLKEKLNAIPIKYRDCEPEDLIISDCLKRIKEEIKDDDDVVLIGSSLGGFLAAKTALNCSNVEQIILFNPAIIPPTVDINTIQDMPQKILQDMQDNRLFKQKINADIYILAGTNDDVVPTKWVLEFAKAQQATIKFLHDDHSLTTNINQIPSMVMNIIGKKH